MEGRSKCLRASELTKRLLLTAALLLCSAPGNAQSLGPADLSDSEIPQYHQNFVLFEAYCGYRDTPTAKCPVAITPSRLYVGDSSIALDQIVDIFDGAGFEDRIGVRFRELSSGLKKSRGGLIGIYYKDSQGSLRLASLGFGRHACNQAFNITLDYIRQGGVIALEDAERKGPCGLTDDTAFDLAANYR